MNSITDQFKVWVAVELIARIAHDDTQRACKIAYEDIENPGLTHVADEMTDGGYSLRLKEMMDSICHCPEYPFGCGIGVGEYGMCGEIARPRGYD